MSVESSWLGRFFAEDARFYLQVGSLIERRGHCLSEKERFRWMQDDVLLCDVFPEGGGESGPVVEVYEEGEVAFAEGFF